MERGIINATNSNDGDSMVLYKNDSGQKFTREESEFDSKFKPLRYYYRGDTVITDTGCEGVIVTLVNTKDEKHIEYQIIITEPSRDSFLSVGDFIELRDFRFKKK